MQPGRSSSQDYAVGATSSTHTCTAPTADAMSTSLDASMNRLCRAHHLASPGCLSLPGFLLSSGSRFEARSSQIGHISHPSGMFCSNSICSHRGIFIKVVRRPEHCRPVLKHPSCRQTCCQASAAAEAAERYSWSLQPSVPPPHKGNSCMSYMCTKQSISIISAMNNSTLCPPCSWQAAPRAACGGHQATSRQDAQQWWALGSCSMPMSAWHALPPA